MLRIYKWRGNTYKIADEDLPKYPGAVLVGAKPEPNNKAKEAPKNKSKAAPKKRTATKKKVK